jgi:hypothetical protein
VDVVFYTLVHLFLVFLEFLVVHYQLLFVVVDTLHLSAYFESIGSSVIFFLPHEVFKTRKTLLDSFVLFVNVSHHLSDLVPYHIELFPFVVILFDLIILLSKLSLQLVDPANKSTSLSRLIMQLFLYTLSHLMDDIPQLCLNLEKCKVFINEHLCLLNLFVHIVTVKAAPLYSLRRRSFCHF